MSTLHPKAAMQRNFYTQRVYWIHRPIIPSTQAKQILEKLPREEEIQGS